MSGKKIVGITFSLIWFLIVFVWALHETGADDDENAVRTERNGSG